MGLSYKENSRKLVGFLDGTRYSSKKAAERVREGISFPDDFEIYKITEVVG